MISCDKLSKAVKGWKNSEKFSFETDGQTDREKSALVKLRFAAKKKEIVSNWGGVTKG